MTINSSWLSEFGTFGADFFTLLKKEDYEEILTLTDGQIRKRIKNINLSNQDVINLERIIATEFKRNYFYLQIFTATKNKIIFLKKDSLEKREKQEKRRLERRARLSKDNVNLKKGYVLLLYALRISKKKIKDEQKELREKMKHNKELLIKAELDY